MSNLCYIMVRISDLVVPLVFILRISMKKENSFGYIFEYIRNTFVIL